MRRTYTWALLGVATCLGLLIASVDSRPGWDDTGITASMIMVVTGLLGFAMPARAWVWALAVGGWIPIVGITLHGNYGALVALIVALVGAYLGAGVRKLVRSVHQMSGDAPNH